MPGVIRFFRVRSILIWLTPALALLSAPCRAQSSANPGAIEVNDPGRYTQVLAISDVHGMYRPLLRLLKSTKVIDGDTHWTAGKTLLIVCGDSIDKGPDSLPILQLWLHLSPLAASRGGRLIVLLGNHEAEFLKNPENGKAEPFLAELKTAGIAPEQLAAGHDKRGIGNFLRRMPVAAKVGKFLFAHAGWYPAQTRWSDFAARSKRVLSAGAYSDAFLTGEHSILEEKDELPPGSDDPEKWYSDPKLIHALEKRLDYAGFYGVIFGHQPHAFGFKAKIGGVDALHIIKIDTGMAPDADESDGEILRFKHPADLLKASAPATERLQANGDHADLKLIETPAD